MSRNNNLTVTQPILDEIAEQDSAVSSYLDGRTFDRSQIIDETKYWLRQHVVTLFEVGRRLMALKQRSEHGEFTKLVEEEFYMTPRYAAQLMSAAKTAIELNKLSGGKIGLEKFDKIDKQKIVLIGSIIDDFKDEIEEIGTIGGKTIDEYDAMSRKQLTDLVKSHSKTIDKGKKEVIKLRDKLLAEKERVEEILSATPNIVSEAVSRLQLEITNGLAAFDTTCKSDDIIPEATLLNLVALKTQVRSFAQAICNIIDDRFDQVHDIEVPSDEDILIPEIVSENPKSKSNKS